MSDQFGVRISGQYSSIVIEYDSLELAFDGKNRAKNKIAFSSSDVEVVEKCGSDWVVFSQ